MRIAIGSTSSVELEAAKDAWKVFSESILRGANDKVEFVQYGVSNGLNSMPLSVLELMTGAGNRVENLILQLKRERAEADFYVGLETGFNVVDSQGPRRLAFLESWAHVSDGHRGSYGHGGGIAVPPRISDPVIDRGIEIGIVLDRISTEQSLESGQGTWAILTRDILNAKHVFVVALISAFAPFYNAEAYGPPATV